MKNVLKLIAAAWLMICNVGAAEAQWEHRPAHVDYGKLFPRGHILDVELENLSVSALAYLQSLVVTQNISSATITTGSGTVTNTLTAGTVSATTVTGAVVNAGTLNIGGTNAATIITNIVQANAPADHEHAADDTTSGTFPLARLPVAADGESSATKVVRADDSRLSGGGAAQTPWTQNIDGGGYDLTGVNNFSAASAFFEFFSVNVLDLTNALAVPSGGTGRTNYTAGAVPIGNGTNVMGEILVQNTSVDDWSANTNLATKAAINAKLAGIEAGDGFAGITGSGSTTNNDDFTTLYSYTFAATNRAAQLNAHVLGAGPTNVYAFNVAAVVQNVAGTAAIVGTNNTYIIPAAGTNITAYWDVSSDTARLRVRGTASENVNWVATNILVNVVTNGAAYVAEESPLLDGLVSHWKLNEASGTRADSHGANNLTDVNTVTAVAGKIGDAGDFVAANSEKLTLAHNADISTGDIDFAFSGWFYRDSGGANRRIFGKGNDGATTTEYELYWNSGNNKMTWVVFSGGTTAVGTVHSTETINTSTWYFFVVWHDAANNTVSISINNGTPAEAATTGSPAAAATANFSIGAKGVTGYWDGLIDSVSFWKRIPTADERTELYNAGAGIDYEAF
jgi:hypothetical protein